MIMTTEEREDNEDKTRLDSITAYTIIQLAANGYVQHVAINVVAMMYVVAVNHPSMNSSIGIKNPTGVIGAFIVVVLRIAVMELIYRKRIPQIESQYILQAMTYRIAINDFLPVDDDVDEK